MATISFVDGVGAVTLSNGKPGAASRFSQWTPDISRVADRRAAVGTGATYEFLYRQDFTAMFAIEHLPLSELADVARFKAWALAGNTFTVNTQDIANRSHLCRIAPDTIPELAMEDRTLLEYRLDVVVISAAAPPVFLTCEYR